MSENISFVDALWTQTVGYENTSLEETNYRGQGTFDAENQLCNQN